MTREEARQVFLSRGYVEVEGGTIYDPNKWREACVVISEWLEQQSCEDAISRDAVFKQLKGCLTGGETEYKYVKMHIDSIPPVTPNEEEMTIKYIEGYNAGFCHAQAIFQKEPKTGHWIRVDKDKCKCDQCEVICFIGVYPNGDKNYCPNCGAKMQEVEE